MNTILVNGGAGFIGSHVVRALVKDYRVINLDKLTYAGNLANLKDVESHPNYRFVHGCITDTKLLNQLEFQIVVHLAAESHVDRSIESPCDFVHTNVLGTTTLLQAARHKKVEIFYHVSTDEVYGSLGDSGVFTEETPYSPRSPYSASKAASDHMVRAFHETYGLPVKISNCSNNYGPNQFPEKLIPLAINNILNKRPIPVYGEGTNVRDWLYVEDHAQAIKLILENGPIGETYNVGGSCEVKNIDLIKLLCQTMGVEPDIQYVKDRPGHDFRYAIDHSKLSNELGWKPSVTLRQGLKKTVDWYLANQEWIHEVTSGAYKDYYARQYATAP